MIQLFIFSLFVAPTFVATTSPFLKHSSVGIPRIPYLVGVFKLFESSIFNLTIFTSVISFEISKRIFSIALQGPLRFMLIVPLTQNQRDYQHHSAQKSTITGFPALMTSVSKFSSVTFTVAICFLYKIFFYIQVL